MSLGAMLLNLTGFKIALLKFCQRFSAVTLELYRMFPIYSFHMFLTEPTYIRCSKTHLMKIVIKKPHPKKGSSIPTFLAA